VNFLATVRCSFLWQKAAYTSAASVYTFAGNALENTQASSGMVAHSSPTLA
jgi:hypothetical protein